MCAYQKDIGSLARRNVMPTTFKFAKSKAGVLLKNLFLTKNVQWKNGPSSVLKKLDFFKEIQNFIVCIQTWIL